LNAYIILLSKRRQALKQVIAAIVKQAMGYLDSATSDEGFGQEERVELIQTLRTITGGKLFLEVESARLTSMLAKIKESEGKIAEAAEILQEVTVETCGAMDNREKAEFILEQVRLLMAKKDFVRASIISKKLKRPKLLKDKLYDLLLRHCKLMIEFNTHEDDMLALTKDYYDIYTTPTVQEDEAKRAEALGHVAIYAALCEYGNHQQDLMARLYTDPVMVKKGEAIAPFFQLVEAFVKQEIAAWPLENGCGEALQAHSVFTGAAPAVDLFSGVTKDGDGDTDMGGSSTAAAASSTTIAAERGKKYWERLRVRVIEHNIRVISRYYAQIRVERLAQLISVDVPAAEKHVSAMVSDASNEHVKLVAKIDRPAGVITFKEGMKKSPNQLLQAWANDISKAVTLVEDTCHLVNREMMVHKLNVK
jgi:26S proteasome regulatory subunit N5